MLSEGGTRRLSPVILLGPAVAASAERLRQEQAIAVELGFASFDEYFKTRRAEGWGYTRIARETGQTRDWVRGSRRRLENVPRGQADRSRQAAPPG